MVRRRTSSGGPSYTACTRCAAWQEANDGRAKERLRVHVAMSQPSDVRLCWGLIVVAGYHRLEDRRKQRYSSLTGCEPEQWHECLACVMAKTAWWIWSVAVRYNMTTVHGWCGSSSSWHRRRTHRGLWRSGPDILSRDRLVRLRKECHGEDVQEHTRWTQSSVRSTAACCSMSTSRCRGCTATYWLGAC